MTTDLLHFFDVPRGGLAELHRRMGKALWFCQCFEGALAHHLCLRYDIPRGTAEDIAARRLAEKRSKTLGRLVREFADKSNPAIPSALEARLTKFTKERNWLAHRVQAENHTDLYHRDRFVRLLDRLDALKTEAHNLSSVFDHLLDDWFKAQGFSQAQLARRMKRTIQEWKAT